MHGSMISSVETREKLERKVKSGMMDAVIA